MKSNLELLKEKIKEFNKQEKVTYVIYGTKGALALYRESLDNLLESNRYDFNVSKYSKQIGSYELFEDVLEIEDYLIIEEKHYWPLYLNLCGKLRTIFNEPMR